MEKGHLNKIKKFIFWLNKKKGHLTDLPMEQQGPSMLTNLKYDEGMKNNFIC